MEASKNGEEGADHEPMITCEHETFGRDWLPILQRKDSLTLAPHPYCGKCGLVRNIGPDRARKLGYYMDILSEIENYLEQEDNKGGKHKLIEAQKRLIVKDMEEDELFQDLYGVLASAQEERFVEIIQEYRPDVDRKEIEYYLE